MQRMQDGLHSVIPVDSQIKERPGTLGRPFLGASHFTSTRRGSTVSSVELWFPRSSGTWSRVASSPLRTSPRSFPLQTPIRLAIPGTFRWRYSKPTRHQSAFNMIRDGAPMGRLPKDRLLLQPSESIASPASRNSSASFNPRCTESRDRMLLPLAQSQ